MKTRRSQTSRPRARLRGGSRNDRRSGHRRPAFFVERRPAKQAIVKILKATTDARQPSIRTPESALPRLIRRHAVVEHRSIRR